MNEMNNAHRIFAVWGSGGSGKTTLAVNLAVLLADSGFMTCLVSANDHGEFTAFLGTAIPKGKGMYAALSNGKHVRESLVEARHNLCILEADTGGNAFDLVTVTPEQVEGILADLRDQFTYVIVDCTASKDPIFTGLGMVSADKVIVCVPHRVSASTWHISNKQMLEAVANKAIYVDCNTREGGCNVDQLLASIDLPACEVKIPCVDSAYYCENRSHPIVLQGGKSEKKYKNQLLKLINIILGIEADETSTTVRNRKKVAEKEKRGSDKGEAEEYDENVSSTGKQRKKIHTTTGLAARNRSGRKAAKEEDETIRRINANRLRGAGNSENGQEREGGEK